MPARIISEEETLKRITSAFREHGYQGTSLAHLSRVTGLGKASLYHHFPGGKEDMAVAVLTHLGERREELVMAPLRGPGAPRERIERMLRGVREFYDGGASPCVVERFGVGEAQALFGDGLAAAVADWEQGIATVLMEAGVHPAEAARRAEDALIRIEGALVIAQAKQSTDVFERTVDALADDLLAAT